MAGAEAADQAAAPIIREGRDDDAEQLIELIGSCFAEYPGCVMDVDGELPELRAIASAYREKYGRFWVAEEGGKVIGCVGVVPCRRLPGMELQKLYVSKESRRRGLAARLCGLVEDEARAEGAEFVELWSDTRFEAAHRLYESLGYVCGPLTRALHDKSNSVERFFRKLLDPSR